MKSDILIIGGGASGLMAAYGAASRLVAEGSDASVTVLEKMPRPARKMMISGKGRCNFTNVKDWNSFSRHIKSKPNFVKSSFYNLPSDKVVDFFESFGLRTVVERGDRAFPESYHASDVVDTLVRACQSVGVKILTECEVRDVLRQPNGSFKVNVSDGSEWNCRRLILATGGLSYPTTGSTGDGLRWAEALGHEIKPCFPSLTALVPVGYKVNEVISRGRGHIDRSTPLTELGKSLCGIQLKNISLGVFIDGVLSDEEPGDIDFTDGGIEGPVGFQVSRKCVKAIINGARVSLRLDMKPGVEEAELETRIRTLWNEISHDPRSKGRPEKELCRILLGKLMPWDLIPGFITCNPLIMKVERKAGVKGADGRYSVGKSKTWIDFRLIAHLLRDWRFDLAGFVGYERCVVTAGGVSTDEVIPKTMESRIMPGLLFCGELLDIDSDTGGYNLQTAFSTGYMAGQSAAASLIRDAELQA